MSTQENCAESSNTINFARTAAAFMMLLVMGYTVSTTSVESAMDSMPAVTAPQDLAPITYFPSQFVNQGRTVDDHIQAF